MNEKMIVTYFKDFKRVQFINVDNDEIIATFDVDYEK